MAEEEVAMAAGAVDRDCGVLMTVRVGEQTTK